MMLIFESPVQAMLLLAAIAIPLALVGLLIYGTVLLIWRLIGR